MSDCALKAAYRQTIYAVEHPSGAFGIRIGEPCAQLDEVLREHGVARWAYVTAWNPRSQKLEDAENNERHAHLLARVRELGFHCLDGWGKSDHSDWREHSLLIFGISVDQAVQLGAAFDQHAVVVGVLGGCAELRWCT